MTGYGRGEAQSDEVGRLVVEVKAVNHRFSEVVIRSPRQLSQLEERLRKIVQTAIARGRVDMFVTWEQTGLRARRIKVDKELAVAYHSALKELGEAIGSKTEISSETVAKLPDVLSVEEGEVGADAFWAVLEPAASQAIANLVAMRDREGAGLARDMEARLAEIERLAGEIQGRAPLVVEEYRTKLARRVEELLPQGVTLDPGRLAQEVAITADRCDIAEELQRLASHIGQFRSVLTADDSVGRKLDFLTQELGREINTIGSKANDAQMAALAIEAKAELEKIREQVQNVE
jgi:uncharacterized protein (TIGR00255 family)